MPELVPLNKVAPEKVERLLDDAFGADRFGRTAYLLRKRSKPIGSLSFALSEEGEPEKRVVLKRESRKEEKEETPEIMGA